MPLGTSLRHVLLKRPVLFTNKQQLAEEIKPKLTEMDESVVYRIMSKVEENCLLLFINKMKYV